MFIAHTQKPRRKPAPVGRIGTSTGRSDPSLDIRECSSRTPRNREESRLPLVASERPLDVPILRLIFVNVHRAHLETAKPVSVTSQAPCPWRRRAPSRDRRRRRIPSFPLP